MGNRGTEWWEPGESGWERGESGWECREWGGNVGNQVGNTRNGDGNGGNQSGNVRNGGGNAGNQGDSLWESLCLLLWLKSRSPRGSISSSQLLWAAAQLLATRFLPCLPSVWVLLRENEDVGSVQDFIFLHLCVVSIGRIRMQEEFKIPLCNPSGGNLLLKRVTFIIP